MTVATATMRQLIPFLMDNGETNWDSVLENEIFDAIINSPPPLYGLENPKFEILGLSSIHGVDEKLNEGRELTMRETKNVYRLTVCTLRESYIVA